MLRVPLVLARDQEGVHDALGIPARAGQLRRRVERRAAAGERSQERDRGAEHDRPGAYALRNASHVALHQRYQAPRAATV